MPRVSVLTCTYNRAQLIRYTIESVLRQTMPDFEYIIVDDGSTDNTAEVVAEFTDPRIKYFTHERTGGHLSRLRNYSHRLANGEFIAYIDSDDLWEPDKLQVQLDGLQDQPHVGFSFSDVDTFDEQGIIRKSLYRKQGTFVGRVLPEILRNGLVICHPTLLLRRSCLDTTGPMDESFHSGDHDMVVHLSCYFDAYAVYRPLAHVRRHAGNSTANHAMNLRLLIEHHRTLGKLASKKLISAVEYDEAIAVSSYGFGVQLLPTRDYDSAYAYFLKSLRLRPLRWKTWVRTLMTLPKKIFRV